MQKILNTLVGLLQMGHCPRTVPTGHETRIYPKKNICNRDRNSSHCIMLPVIMYCRELKEAIISDVQSSFNKEAKAELA
jgi:hypothetical protein